MLRRKIGPESQAQQKFNKYTHIDLSVFSGRIESWLNLKILQGGRVIYDLHVFNFTTTGTGAQHEEKYKIK